MPSNVDDTDFNDKDFADVKFNEVDVNAMDFDDTDIDDKDFADVKFNEVDDDAMDFDDTDIDDKDFADVKFNEVDVDAMNFDDIDIDDMANDIVKVPVLLQEVSVQIPLKARIKFPEPVLEIKKIKKRVKVTQCRLIQPRGTTGPRGKLFLSGFVRKNIQFASPCNADKDAVFSRLHSLTVDIPFDCVVEINQFLTPPIGPFFNVRREFDFLTNQPLPSGFPEKDELMSTDPSQYHQQSTEFFNEMIFCELVRSDITEWDESTNRKPLKKGPFEEGVFTKLEEKMVLDLRLKVLQNQQVHIVAAEDGGE